LPEMFVEDVAFDNISVYLDPDNTKGGVPVMAPNIPDMCRAGIVIKNARNVKLRRVDVLNQIGPAVSITNSQEIAIGELYARRDGKSPVVEMDGREVGEQKAR
jgi:hypothetical protein